MFIRTFSDYNLRSIGTYLGYIAYKHATAKPRTYTASTRSPRIHSAKTRAPKSKVEKLSKAELDYICSDKERYEAHMAPLREKLANLEVDRKIKTREYADAVKNAAEQAAKRQEEKRLASLPRKELAAERLAKHRKGENPYV